MGTAEWFIALTLCAILAFEIVAVWRRDDDIETISQATWRALRADKPLMRFVLIAVGVVLGHLFW